MQDAILGLRKRIDRMEAQLRRLSAQAGLPYDDGSGGVPPEVTDLVRAGKRMQAVMRYTELTGADLAVAKEVVDQL